MTTAIQRRRGTTTEHSSFTGLEGEISVNTTKDTLVVHDGSTAGGFELARADGSNFVASGVDINSGTIDGTTIGASSASTGAFTTLTASGEITANGGIALGDNDKATFGAGDDLQIYHDGSNSYVQDAGTGDLIVRANNLALQATSGEQYAAFVANGSASLFYDNAQKLATTATGIDVTGTATMDGLTVTGSDAALAASIGTDAQRVYITPSGTVINYNASGDSAGSHMFQTGNVNRLNIASNGNISFYEDTGTTPKFFWDASAESLGIGTSSPSNTVTVNSTAGAGIKVYGADQAHSRIAIDNLNGQEWNLVAGTAGSSNSGFGIYDVDAGATRLQIDSSGNVGIQSTDPTNNSVGGVGGLVIGNGTGNKGLTLFGSSTAQQNIAFTDTSNSQQGLIQYDHGGDYMRLFTSATERLRIDSSGNVGIGTSSPLSKLNAKGTQGNWRVDPDSVSGEIQVFSTTTANDGFRDFRIRTQQTIFDTAGTERMRIDSSGNLYCSGGSGGTVLTLTASSGTTSGDIGRIRFGNNNIDSNLVNIVGYQDGATNSGGLKFETQPTGGATVERMRIDSSGNLLVGTTDTFPGGGDTNTGVSLTSTGAVVASRDGDFAARFNRKTSDGDIVQFNKDGTTVGSIGAFTAGTSAVFFGSLDTALLANSGNDCIHPWNASTNSNRDNVIDFGNASNRWNDIYATNGTIQTSDFNEKQDIAELSDAEQRVAVAAKGLLRKFRWKDSVAEKGDEARIHFGIIAQDLQAAFEAEGLDAGDYAMFISTTWTDEETNEEKTRMGVRYSELLAFIIAAL